MSNDDQDERRPALGTPAPLSQEQVDALVRGRPEAADIAQILASHPQPETKEKPRRLRTLSPVPLDEKTLSELSRGKTTGSVAKRFKEAARKDKDTTADIDSRRERPTRKAPRAAPPTRARRPRKTVPRLGGRAGSAAKRGR